MGMGGCGWVWSCVGARGGGGGWVGGGEWERRCHEHLLNVGFESIPDRRSCYVHPKLHVYVDDRQVPLTMTRQKVRMESHAPLGKYLGCGHKVSTAQLNYCRPEHARRQCPPLESKNGLASPIRLGVSWVGCARSFGASRASRNNPWSVGASRVPRGSLEKPGNNPQLG